MPNCSAAGSVEGRGKDVTYIFASDQKSIIDSSFVERFCLVEKPDAYMIVASYSAEHMVTIGKYKDRAEADSALYMLYRALGTDEPFYEMPDSTLFHGDSKKYDARTKRKGGS